MDRDDDAWRPTDWFRRNAFILILAGVVAVALIGDRVAHQGLNPADDPKFARAPVAEAPADPAPAAASEDAKAAEAPPEDAKDNDAEAKAKAAPAAAPDAQPPPEAAKSSQDQQQPK